MARKRSKPSKPSKRKRVVADDPLATLGGNSHRHIKRVPNPILGPTPFILETVYFTRIGHTFGLVPYLDTDPAKKYLVQDFLLDQTGASGADGKMLPTTQFDLTTTTRFRFNVLPRDRARRVRVVPPGTAQLFLYLNVGRKFISAAGDHLAPFALNPVFVNLQGPAPTFTYEYFALGRNTNHWVEFFIEAEVHSEFSFYGFSAIGDYPMRTFDPGTKAYETFSSSTPLNLPGTASVPFMMFSHQTTSSIDPGPCIFLE